MVEIVIGDYTAKKDEFIPDKFHSNIVFKNGFTTYKKVVLYAELLGLTKRHIREIIKKATQNVIIVVSNKTLINGIRKSKKCKITHNYETQITSPFEIAKYVMGVKDRDYIYNFLKDNKVQLYMLTRVLVSNFNSFTRHNQQWIAYIDTILWKCKPDIIYAILAYKVKYEHKYSGKYGFMKWNYPKKDDK